MDRLALLLVVFFPVMALAEEPPGQIIVSATGSVASVPDMATVSIGVSREARTASEAMQAVSAATASVIGAVQSAGIEDRDIQTASVNLNPVWDHGNTRPPQLRGYLASTTLSVRVRDLDTLGGLLDTVVGEGANQLQGLTFGISESDPLERIARADAVQRARQKAETLAEAAGVVLGPVRSISEADAPGMPSPLVRGAMMEAAAMPIASGELDIRVAVTMVYEIAD